MHQAERAQPERRVPTRASRFWQPVGARLPEIVSDMSERPKVSVGMPVFNGERHIARAIESLLAQDYGDFEIIISDNASTDATAQICQAFARRDRRIKYQRNESNIGAPKNFERVFRLCSGPLFMWAGDHDLWAPTFISRCVSEIERHPGVVLCYPRAAWIAETDAILEPMPPIGDTRGLDPLARFHVTMWQGHGYLIYGVMRADALRATSLGITAIGFDLVLLGELALQGEFALIPEVLHFARRMSDFGQWRRYADKLGMRLTRATAVRLYLDLTFHHLRTVARGVRGWVRKPLALTSVLLCMTLRYRWILTGLLAAARGDE